MAKSPKQGFNSGKGKLAARNDVGTGRNKRKPKISKKNLKRLKQKEELDRIVLQSKKSLKERPKKSKLKLSAMENVSSVLTDHELFSLATTQKPIQKSKSGVNVNTNNIAEIENAVENKVRNKSVKGKNFKIETDPSKQLPDTDSPRKGKPILKTNKELLQEKELGQIVLQSKKSLKERRKKLKPKLSKKARSNVSTVSTDRKLLSLTAIKKPSQKSKSNVKINTACENAVESKVKNKLAIKSKNSKIETDPLKQLSDLDMHSPRRNKPILKINKEMLVEEHILSNIEKEQTVEIRNTKKDEIMYIEMPDCTKYHGLLLLSIGAEAMIHGKCKICVMKGHVNVVGKHGSVSSKMEEITLFSPTSSSLVTIKEISKKKEKLSKARQDFLKELLSKDDWKIIKETNKFQGVILIVKLEPSCVDFITKFKAYSDVFGSIPKVYKTSECTFPMLSITDEWETTLEHLATIFQTNQGRNGFTILLCGSKNMGKSTFARCLINTLLQRSPQVFFLECDVGQTEFTPPGIISLTSVNEPVIGPAFTHQKRPSIAKFFGDITPKDNPDLYIRCIQKTFGIYQEQFGHQGPLIVNTMGWIKGMGLPLLIDVIRLIKPSAVVQFGSNVDANKNLSLLSDNYIATQPGWAISENEPDPEGSTSDGYQEHCDSSSTLPVRGNDNTDGINTSGERTSYISIIGYEESDSQTVSNPLKAADHRTMAMLAYFGKLFERKQKEVSDGSNGSNSIEWIHRPFQYLVPYAVKWKDVAVHVMHVKVQPSKILYAINCSVVCLAEVDPTLIIDDSSPQFPGLPKFLREMPLASYHGLGFIRNIDPQKQLFYVLTPEPMSVLSKVNAFIKGNIDISSHLLTQDIHTPGPYKTWDKTSVSRGSSARKPRFNLRRRRLDSPLDVDKHVKKRKST